MNNEATFSGACTHLIVGQPTRSEKFLASMAAGKWILKTEYILESRAAGSFLEETPFEWAEGARTGASFKDDTERDLALAARRWRIAIADPHATAIAGGAFTGWRVVLVCEQQKKDGFMRLLEAGGAQVLLASTPANLASLRIAPLKEGAITHAFVGVTLTADVHAVLRRIVPRKVPLLSHEYIADYLIRDPTPQPNASYIIREDDGSEQATMVDDEATLKRRSSRRAQSGSKKSRN